jgi:cytochrome c oxidase subunit 2
MSFAPLNYLESAGRRADTIVPLTWFTLAISVIVCLAIGVMLWIGGRRARLRGGAEETRAVAVESGRHGVSWIAIGLALSAAPILATLIWTIVALASTAVPTEHPGLVLDVSAHQWWWEVRYHGAAPSDSFTTANEIHIPIGVHVLVQLRGSDVIHSFWVPKLSGKIDAIPGQTNITWLQAARPGRYLGRCGEYCGAQHAHMAFEVVAEPRDAFDRWRARQLQTAPPPVTPEQQRGLAIVQFRCGLCHQVRGTDTAAVSAPDLTHLMSRRTIAAGTLPNTPGNLAAWIIAPQSLKPGTLMPSVGLSGPELADASAYLETLR